MSAPPGLVAPIGHLAQLDMREANTALVAWEHRMGPCNRPNADIWAHGWFEHGRLAAVTVTASLVRETCAGLSRDEAVELARLCAVRPGLCRVMLRLWRELVLPSLAPTGGWAVSYQDEALHTGDTYRFDGWVQIGRSRSGTDQRSGRKGRSKTIWGWHPESAMREARRVRAAA